MQMCITLSESALKGFNKLWLLVISHVFSPYDQPLENWKGKKWGWGGYAKSSKHFKYLLNLIISNINVHMVYLFETPLLMVMLCISGDETV